MLTVFPFIACFIQVELVLTFLPANGVDFFIATVLSLSERCAMKLPAQETASFVATLLQVSSTVVTTN